MFVDLKFKTANVYNKKQPLEVFYKKAVLKIPVFESLLKKVAGLQICNFLKKRFQRRCFSVNIANFFFKIIFKKICKRLLLSNVKRNYSSMKIVK